MNLLSRTLLGLFVVVFGLFGAVGFAAAQGASANNNKMQERMTIADEDGDEDEDDEEEEDDENDDDADDEEEGDDEDEAEEGEEADDADERVEICHQTGNGEMTIEVSEQAKEAHVENHGDTVGACDGEVATSSDEDQADDDDDENEDATSTDDTEDDEDDEFNFSDATPGEISSFLDDIMNRVQELLAQIRG